MALIGVERETLVFEPDAQTTRPPPRANSQIHETHIDQLKHYAADSNLLSPCS